MRTMADLPQDLKPMLASTAEPFDSPDFLFEPKWDGFRCLAYLEKGTTQLKSRSGSDLSGSFPELASLHKCAAGIPAVLDGEIIAFHEGRESFYHLQQRVRHGHPGTPLGKHTQLAPIIFIAFDILYSGGKSVLAAPLEDRKELLRRTVADENQHLLINSYILEAGEALYAAAVAQGREGIVAKKRDSPYLPGKRSKLWLKIKPKKTVDAVVVGYVPKTDDSFVSLVLAQYSPKGELLHVGSVGTGFTEQETREILAELKPLSGKKPAVQRLRQPAADVIWVKPEMVVEVRIFEYTPRGTLRHPVYCRRREDLNPEQCVIKSWLEKGDG